jgi:hypothetical protein
VSATGVSEDHSSTVRLMKYNLFFFFLRLNLGFNLQFCFNGGRCVMPQAPARERSMPRCVMPLKRSSVHDSPGTHASLPPLRAGSPLYSRAKASGFGAFEPSAAATGRCVLAWLPAEADMRTEAAEPVSAPAEAGSGPENADQVGRPPPRLPLIRSPQSRVRRGEPGQRRYAGRHTRAHGHHRPPRPVVVRLLSADSAALSGRRR